MKKKERLIDRRVIGLHVVAGVRSFPQCSLVYEVTYLLREKGVITTRVAIERGRSIRAYPDFEEMNTKNPSKKQAEKFRLMNRSDLSDNIHASAVLMRGLEAACLSLDEFFGVKTGRPD